MTLNFYIGRISFEFPKKVLLGGLAFELTIRFYGKGYYKFRRKMRELRRKRGHKAKS